MKKPWKILYLGASQEKHWERINLSVKKHWYQPVETGGSFAVIFHRSIWNELRTEINRQGLSQGAFDSYLLRKMHQKYLGQVWVAYPNLAIADVRESNIPIMFTSIFEVIILTKGIRFESHHLKKT